MAYYEVPGESGSVLSGLSLSNDSMHIKSGGTATDTTVLANGLVYVSEGGLATHTTMNSGGSMKVDSGGNADGITVSNGTVHIYSGGLVNGIFLHYSGNAVIHSGVELTSAISGYGRVTIENGALVSGLSGCCANVSGTLTEATVSDYQEFSVESGGKLVSATAFESGRIVVGNSGLMEDTVIKEGKCEILSGGSAKNTVFHSWGELYVSAGGIVDGVKVDSNGEIIVSDGSATNLTIDCGNLTVLGNASVTDFTLGENGAIFLNVNSGASTYVSGKMVDGASSSTILLQNGHIQDMTVKNGGAIRLNSGGVADNITFENGRAEISGGTLNNATFVGMASGGVAWLRGGLLNGATFESGTGLNMYSGTAKNVSALGANLIAASGTIDNTLVTSGGSLTLYDGITANGIVLSHGVVSHESDSSAWSREEGGKLLITYGGIASDITVWDFASVQVDSSGFASDTVLNSGGAMHVSSGGKAVGVTVSSGGSIVVDFSASAADVSVAAGGRVKMYIAPDTHISGTCGEKEFKVDGVLTSAIGAGFQYYAVNGGSVTVPAFVLNEDEYLGIYSGATFEGGITVNRGGSVYIDYGANTAGTVLENGGYVSIADDANITFQSNTVNDLQLTSGLEATVHSSTVANGTLIRGTADPEGSGTLSVLWVYGGIANDTEIREYGQLYLNDGGSAFRTGVHSDGTLYLYRSSFASDTVVAGSSALISVNNGCTAVSTTLKDSGSMEIRESGMASSTTVSAGGVLSIDGGSVIDTVVIGGSMDLCGQYSSESICGASKTTVVSGGILAVHSYGLAVDTTVGAGGSMALFSSGSASGTTVESGGCMIVSDGGKAVGTSVETNGALHVSSDGTAEKTTVKENGALHVSSGGSASFTTVETNGAFHVSSDGIILSTTVKTGGNIHVSSGGTAGFTTVASDGDFHVSSGGTAYGVSVENGGRMEIVSGGVLAGTVTIASGGELAVDGGGSVLFDLSTTAPGTNIQVDNLTGITGNPDYRILVSDFYQEMGAYTFATGATGFTGSMTIVDAGPGTELGTLSAGESIEVNGIFYSLAVEDDALSLSVSDYPLVHDDGPDDHWNNYVYDKKAVPPENPNLGEFVVNELEESSAEVLLDRKYSVMVDDMHNFVGKVQGFEPYEDDDADYAKIELATGAKLTFNINSQISGQFVIYSYDEKTNKLTKLQSTAIKIEEGVKSKTTPTKERFFEAGEYYIAMQAKMPKKGYAPNGFYNVYVGKTAVFFSDDDSGWNNWLYDKKKTPDDNSANLNDETIDTVGEYIQLDNECYVDGDNFVGFGDDTDFVKIRLNSAANLSLNVAGVGMAPDVKNSGALKLTVYSFDASKKKMTSLQSTSFKSDAVKAGADTKLKLLEAGTYYVSVQASNAKKGDKVYYDLTVGSSTVFFDNIDSGWNNYVYDKKAKQPVNEDIVNGEGFAIEVGNKGEAVSFDYDMYTFKGKDYTGFVGHNDDTDFRKISVAKAGTVSFKVEATDAAKIEIWQFDSGKLKMKSLQSTALKKTSVVNGVQMYGIETKAYAFKESGEYYLAITSTNAKSGGNAYYNVTLLDTDIVDSASLESALALPDASVNLNGWDAFDAADSSLNLQDVLGFNQYAADASAFGAASPFDALNSRTEWQDLANLA